MDKNTIQGGSPPSVFVENGEMDEFTRLCYI